jgi:hypothetical protein
LTPSSPPPGASNAITGSRARRRGQERLHTDTDFSEGWPRSTTQISTDAALRLIDYQSVRGADTGGAE